MVYDEGRGFFRFSDGSFALSHERAVWPALKDARFFRFVPGGLSATPDESSQGEVSDHTTRWVSPHGPYLR